MNVYNYIYALIKGRLQKGFPMGVYTRTHINTYTYIIDDVISYNFDLKSGLGQNRLVYDSVMIIQRSMIMVFTIIK